MSIRTKIALTILLFVVVLAATVVAISQTFMDAGIEVAANDAIREAEETFALLEARDIERLQAVNEVVRSRSDLQELFLARDRDGMYKAAQPVFERLKNDYGITHMYFIDPPPSSEVFLRLQKQGTHGDVVERQTYLDSVAMGSWASGKDMGKVRIGLRTIHPWEDESGQVVGYVEIAQRIEEFLDTMAEQTGDEYALISRKEIIKEEDWVNYCETFGLKNTWDDHDDFVVVHATSEQVGSEDFEDLSLEQAVSEPGSYRTEIEDGREYIVGTFPVEDVSGEVIAAVVVEHDASALYAEFRGMRTRVVIVVLATGLVLTGVVILLLNGLVFGRLDAMVQRMEDASVKVTSGDFDVEMPPVVGNDELSGFERFFGQFLDAVAGTIKQLLGK